MGGNDKAGDSDVVNLSETKLNGADKSDSANGTGATGCRGERATAILARGRSVIVVGKDLTLDKWIAATQEALSKARRAKSYGLTLDSFLKMLRDLSRE